MITSSLKASTVPNRPITEALQQLTTIAADNDPALMPVLVTALDQVLDRYLNGNADDRQLFKEAFTNKSFRAVRDQIGQALNFCRQNRDSSDLRTSVPRQITDFRNELYAEVCSGRKPELFTDVTDTLGKYSSTSHQPFRGVPEAIARYLKTAPFTLISGDVFSQVYKGFLQPAGLCPAGDLHRLGRHLSNLKIFTRYGLETASVEHSEGQFKVSGHRRGIPEDAIPKILEVWDQLCKGLPGPWQSGAFMAEVNGLRAVENREPGVYEIRGSAEHDNLSIVFSLLGVLDKESREVFKTDRYRLMRRQLHVVADEFNRGLKNRFGIEALVAAWQEGLSTITVCSIHKGQFIQEEAAQRKAGPAGQFLIFIGDNTIEGNDEEGAKACDAVVQVGMKDITEQDLITRGYFQATADSRNSVADYIDTAAKSCALFDLLY